MEVDLLHNQETTINLKILEEAEQWQDLSASNCLVGSRGDTQRIPNSRDMLLKDNDGNAVMTLVAFYDDEAQTGVVWEFEGSLCDKDGWKWKKK